MFIKQFEFSGKEVNPKKREKEKKNFRMCFSWPKKLKILMMFQKHYGN